MTFSISGKVPAGMTVDDVGKLPVGIDNDGKVFITPFNQFEQAGNKIADQIRQLVITANMTASAKESVDTIVVTADATPMSIAFDFIATYLQIDNKGSNHVDVTYKMGASGDPSGDPVCLAPGGLLQRSYQVSGVIVSASAPTIIEIEVSK